MLDWNSLVPGCISPEGVATLACVPAVFRNVVNGTLIFAGVIALFFIIFSGFKLATAQGDPKQLEGARHTLMYAIIGLLIILFSFFILNLISYVTGVTCLTEFGFTNCR